MRDDFTKTEILELANEFRKRRTQLGLTQLKLSKLANISQSMIHKLEKCLVDPSYSTILRIEEALSNQEKINDYCAKDIMSQDIVSVTPQTKLAKAIKIMAENDFSQLLILKRGKVSGMIYEKAILDAITAKKDIYSVSVSSFIKPAPLILPPEMPIGSISHLFSNNQVKCLVVAKEQQVLGVITKSDLFRKT